MLDRRIFYDKAGSSAMRRSVEQRVETHLAGHRHFLQMMEGRRGKILALEDGAWKTEQLACLNTEIRVVKAVVTRLITLTRHHAALVEAGLGVDVDNTEEMLWLFERATRVEMAMSRTTPLHVTAECRSAVFTEELDKLLEEGGGDATLSPLRR